MSIEDTQTSSLPDRSQIHWLRRMFHMFSGVLMVFIGIQLDNRRLSLILLGGVLLTTLLIEGVRLLSPRINAGCASLFRGIMRRGEDRHVSGIAYYMAGCFVCYLFLPPSIAYLAILFLAFGDPIASLAGVTLGHRRLRDSVKTVEGSAACFLVCGIITAFMSIVVYRWDHSWDQVLLVSVLGGVSGTLGELMPLRTDDNLAMPVVSGALMWLIFSLLNLIPGLYL